MYQHNLKTWTCLLPFSLLAAGGWSQANQNFPGSWPREDIFFQMVAKDSNYFVIDQQANLYLQNNPQDSSFAKKYARWDYFWASRVSATGDFSLANQVMNSIATSPICNGSGDWEEVGPRVYNKQAMGIVVSVYSPPSNPNIIYAGSNSAGLWKSTDGGILEMQNRQLKDSSIRGKFNSR